MPLWKSMFATLLTLSLFSDGAQAQGWFQWSKWSRRKEMMVIGYAAVSRWEALAINTDSELWVKDSPHNLQLGRGFYLVNTPGRWMGQEEESWYCVVKARRGKIESAGKVYIPSSYEKLTPAGFVTRNLWAADEAAIVEYIGSEAYISKPGEALRFSWTPDAEDPLLQMVIPTAVVNDDKLRAWAQCFESEDELKQVSDATIDWKAWKIKGFPRVAGSSWLK
ncbi:uncharacterized protein L3040_002213 [Drepanopeziza brunnea f. sp. 'multigermtubi']|uniref:Uncharacterized protein n=1 Tax=Marssonina brunnea f. sp. multigermtubi (strain MB_m1) TaxID=1072389 RepID=K1X4V3_MARBU|nr:uncharacterized protein MBM_02064 [Drepanopeziza brunnea f. sp. 'multigermtubi' MB_m1]EKD20112.1 hypothetical protein MBM_02064 [Drepanopeziza brunnea f. sp. 'multigermtubi' MB_m1]KAJ5050330.1 hypothetical protein L3040_002213 [Drepanopeziza brunnea f. sp. 'multigermtubi']